MSMIAIVHNLDEKGARRTPTSYLFHLHEHAGDKGADG